MYKRQLGIEPLRDASLADMERKVLAGNVAYEADSWVETT